MSDAELTPAPIWVAPTPPSVAGSSLINLANLLLRETNNRITTLQRCDGPNPELFVVSRVDWKDPDPKKPILPQLPKILSLLETLRETGGVPHEIFLESNDGVAVYLPIGSRTSDLPRNPKEAIRVLMTLVHDTIANVLSTMREVENCFWIAARRKGFSPEIVQRMALKEQHYDSPAFVREFHSVLRKYFSIRFHIQRSESSLYVEEVD
jgi:hypothetical protein